MCVRVNRRIVWILFIWYICYDPRGSHIDRKPSSCNILSYSFIEDGVWGWDLIGDEGWSEWWAARYISAHWTAFAGQLPRNSFMICIFSSWLLHGYSWWNSGCAFSQQATDPKSWVKSFWTIFNFRPIPIRLERIVYLKSLMVTCKPCSWSYVKAMYAPL